MLAGKAPEDLSTLVYPVYASPKLDGIRCIINEDGVAVSRKLKPIPNEYVRSCLDGLPCGLDGELMVDGGFNSVQSAIMSRDGTPDFTFWVFDWWGIPGGYGARYKRIQDSIGIEMCRHAQTLDHRIICSDDELLEFEQKCLEHGFEGAMVRDPDGPYKFGRSTTKQAILLKIKRFETEEATVIGWAERMHNANELQTDELGHAKRSSAKAGKVSAGDMGALQCRTPDGAEFGIGIPANHRRGLWERRNELEGQLVTFRHQPDPGGRQPGQAPRIPIFLGIRHRDDT